MGDLSLFLLGLNVNSIPIASGDFTNIATNDAADGVYTIDGEPCEIGDIIDLDHGETNFDAVLDLDAGGIKTRFNEGAGTYTTRQFAINSPLLESLLASGFTVLLEFYAETLVAASLSVHDNAFNFDSGAGSTNDPGGPTQRTRVSDKDQNAVFDTEHYPDLMAENRLAVTVAGDHVSASVNGDPIVTIAASGLDATMANIVFSFSGGADERLRSFAFYEPVADADLPTLSAL